MDPAEFAGNWMEFEAFAWHDQPEDAENWGIQPLDHRDSSLLGESNANAVRAMLEAVDPEREHWAPEHFNHFLVGWQDGVSVRVWDADGKLTAAFRTLQAIETALEDYPVLDEEDYSARQHEAELESISYAYVGPDYSPASDLPDDWVEQVWRHLWNRSIYSDGETGYLNEDEVRASMLALGFLEDEWGLRVPAEGAPASDWRTYHIKVWWAQTKSEVRYQLRRPFWRWRRLAAAYQDHRSGAGLKHPWWQYLWK